MPNQINYNLFEANPLATVTRIMGSGNDTLQEKRSTHARFVQAFNEISIMVDDKMIFIHNRYLGEISQALLSPAANATFRISSPKQRQEQSQWQVSLTHERVQVELM